MNQFIGLIAVKGNSDRVRKKNIRPFYDTNLLQLKIKQLKTVENIDEIIVSSESEECLDIAKDNDVTIHKRDPKFSTSDIPMSDVYSYLASECSGENIVWVPVTNPLVNSKIYQEAITQYKLMDSKYDCLLSAVKSKDYLFYKNKPIGFKPNPWPRSQDLSNLSVLSFAVNILKRRDMIKFGSLVGNNPFFYYLDRIVSWDIDFQEDFDFCEMIYKEGFNY
jgi:N-acylneuraminate cytidylyltransferase